MSRARRLPHAGSLQPIPALRCLFQRPPTSSGTRRPPAVDNHLNFWPDATLRRVEVRRLAAPLLQSSNSTAALHLSSDVGERPLLPFVCIMSKELVKRPWPRHSQLQWHNAHNLDPLSPLDSNAQPLSHFSRQSPRQAPFLHTLQRPWNMGLPLLCTPRYRRQAIYRGCEPYGGCRHLLTPSSYSKRSYYRTIEMSRSASA